MPGGGSDGPNAMSVENQDLTWENFRRSEQSCWLKGANLGILKDSTDGWVIVQAVRDVDLVRFTRRSR